MHLEGALGVNKYIELSDSAKVAARPDHPPRLAVVCPCNHVGTRKLEQVTYVGLAVAPMAF